MCPHHCLQVHCSLLKRYSVPHDRLFLDALERYLKCENMGFEPTTAVVGEPAFSFTYDSRRGLYEQFSMAQSVMEVDGDANRNTRVPQMNRTYNTHGSASTVSGTAAVHNSNSRELHPHNSIDGGGMHLPSAPHHPNTTYLPFSTFRGSPYWRGRKESTNRSGAVTRSSLTGSNGSDISVGCGPSNFGMTAADMFISQPRGEQDPSARQTKAMLQARRGQPSAHNGPILGQPSTGECIPSSLPPFSEDSLLHTFSDVGGHSGTGKALTTKVFICPLFCCGRLFKHMEHLKRYMRTHTMERPFQCDRCQKGFSRSDNLDQHLRIHARAEGADTPSGELVAFDASDVENEDTEDVDAAFFRGVSDSYFLQSVTGDHSAHVEPLEMDWATSSSLVSAACNGEPIMGSLAIPSHGQEFPLDGVALCQSLAASEIGLHRRHKSATPVRIRSHSASSCRRNYSPYSRTSRPVTSSRYSSTPSHAMSSHELRVTRSRSSANPSLGQRSLDIGDISFDSTFSRTMAYFSEPDDFELSQKCPDLSFE
jgi:transcription factor STE12